MSINTQSITPLMFAAADGFSRNEGFGVNLDLHSQLVKYTDVYSVSPSSVGLTLKGTLGSDGVNLYDIWYEGFITDPNVVTVTSRIDNLGPLSSIIPGGWVIDGVLYNGSLSGFGGMVAERISPGFLSNVSTPGRYRTYMGDATKQTLGSTALPAITQTVPATVSGLTGSLMYHVEHAINLPLGSNLSQNISTLSTTIEQASGYVQQSNTYLSAIKTAESTNLSHYGYSSYQDYISQGWLRYKKGSALPRAFTNIGTMTDSIFTSKFGTPGAVAYVLMGRSLGLVGNLGAKLVENQVNTVDLMNPMYDAQIRSILASINDPDDLATIQNTIESTIPNMTSALDYIDISVCAGMENDSNFSSFAEIGADLYSKSPHMTIERGSNIAQIIEKLEVPHDPVVEGLAGNNSLISSTITSTLRNQFPVSATNTDLTIMDVIGTPSGYYAANIAAVSSAVSDLDNTAYGPAIRTELQALVNFTNQIGVIMAGNGSVVGVSGTVTTEPDSVGTFINIGALPIGTVVAPSIDTGPYYALMNQIKSDTDPVISGIVSRMTTNYEYITQRVNLESYNWNKLGMLSQSFDVSGAMIMFAQSLANYALDRQGIGLYDYVKGLVQDTPTGKIVNSILSEARNYNLIETYAQSPNGYIG